VILKSPHNLLSLQNLVFKTAIFLFLVCSVVSPAFAAILNPQEQQIADYMAGDSKQGRAFLTLDPILAGVARARATDMAKRHYFAHVNPDGVAANYLVAQAGYKLPDWWGTERDANYIESIAAGYSTASAAWNGWMDSPDHRTHILGLNSFYASETSYGIGYYYDSSSDNKYYWVIITAPPQPAPKLAIKTPAVGARVTESSVAVAGTARTDSGASSVMVRIENANSVGNFQLAAGVTDWSAVASNLAPGPNTIRVRSLDANSALIAEVTRVVDYVQIRPLTVLTSGSGSITSGFAGVTSREVGQTYRLVATPAPGNLFAGWTGGSDAKSATLSFVMREGLTLQANFIPNPFLTSNGKYFGLAGAASHPGFVKIALTPTGAFTGRLTIDGASYSFTARFDLSGAATVTLPRKEMSPLVLNLRLDPTDGSGKITGNVSSDDFTGSVSADLATFNATANRAPQAGRYTVVLAAPSAVGVPEGSGCATMIVAPNGTTVIVGRLADDSLFSQSSMVSKTGELPLCASVKNKRGFLAGTVRFAETTTSDLAGTVTWTKPANDADAFYPAAFAAQLSTVGSRYTAPALTLPAGSGNTSVTLGGGNIGSEIAFSATVSLNNQVTAATPDAPNFTASINSANGLVIGSFIHPSGARRGVRAVVLQKQNAAFGHFRGIDQTGYFTLGSN
jgi:hypothetical protein